MTTGEGSPIAGRGVVVTRSRSQSSELVERLTGLGAAVVELPVIAIEDPLDGGAALAVATDRLVAGHYEWVAFTSANAVTRLFGVLDGRTLPAGVHWAVVGPGTERALARGGFRADAVPDSALAEGLVDLVGEPTSERRGVLFARAETVSGVLAAGLRARGWTVDEVVAYRTVAGHPDAAAVDAAGRCTAIAFTSSSTVNRTIEVLGVERIPPVVVSIGPVTSGAARAAGLEVSAEADPHTIDGVIDALVAALADHRRRDPQP